nr:MAG TPA: hypothetical protein [Bacteriophage sp.]
MVPRNCLNYQNEIIIHLTMLSLDLCYIVIFLLLRILQENLLLQLLHGHIMF